MSGPLVVTGRPVGAEVRRSLVVTIDFSEAQFGGANVVPRRATEHEQDGVGMATSTTLENEYL